MTKHLLLAAGFVCVRIISSAQSISPLTPEQALAAFHLEPALKIQLVAAEPLVIAPVAMTFDQSGRLYVVENRGYPTGPGPGKPPAGVVALLEDTDGDGRYDKRTVFADGLTFPNGIMPWRDGFLVTCAPDIIFLKDSDGDGRADIRRVILTGFEENNTTQLRVSHPILGPDNWIYVTSGLTGGKIRKPEFPNAVPLVTKTDLRFRPDTWDFEAADGRAQFGMSFDDFGHRFICMNRVQVQHVVLPSRYLRRNPVLPLIDTVQNVPETMMAEPLPGHGSAARIYPISHNITTADSHAGTFTAACGVTIYRGTGLPPDYYGNALSCDPTGNLVHRDRLNSEGATFRASRAHETDELVASTDDWFRPVYLSVGPDGALYICDMYRKTIEHPAYLPDEVRKRTDFDSGKDKGRIYRVVASNRPSHETFSFPTTTAGLCAELNHPNGWRRDRAHRLLLQKADSAMIAPLRQFFTTPKISSPAGRVLALYLLDRVTALDESTLLRGLEDAHPGVRENAAILAEPRLRSLPKVREKILKLAEDPDFHVRFHAALDLGDVQDSSAIPALAKIAVQSASDKWTRAAVFSSIGGRQLEFARVFAPLLMRSQTGRGTQPGLAELTQELGRELGSTQPTNNLDQSITALLGKLQSATVAPWQIPALNGFLAAMDKRGIRDLSLLRQPGTQDAGANLSERIAVLERRARSLSGENDGILELRQAAVDLVARLQFPGSKEVLLRALEARQPPALQASAIRALSRGTSTNLIAELLTRERWQTYTPIVRETLLESLLSSSDCVPALLTAIDSGQVPPAVINSARRKQLLQSKDVATREHAAALFKNAGSPDRMKVYEQYKPVLSLSPVPSNGREMFKRHCSICHRLDREGVPVGPDLFSIRNQSKETILLHIIVPEFEIMPGFVNFLVETKDGRSLSGIIAAETPESVTLRGSLNQEETIARSNLLSIISTGLSLMPQELEKAMTRQQMADLLAYLKGEAAAP
jgi:putative membrane-bound dehydrogenase-like protein